MYDKKIQTRIFISKSKFVNFINKIFLINNLKVYYEFILCFLFITIREEKNT